VYIKENSLVIKRTDTGKIFAAVINDIPLSFPLPDDLGTITLMEDDINRLRMQRITNYSARFYSEQTDGLSSSMPANLNEHFGLIIICTSANSFIYTHNPATGSNTFTAVINL